MTSVNDLVGPISPYPSLYRPRRPSLALDRVLHDADTRRVCNWFTMRENYSMDSCLIIFTIPVLLISSMSLVKKHHRRTPSRRYNQGYVVWPDLQILDTAGKQNGKMHIGTLSMTGVILPPSSRVAEARCSASSWVTILPTLGLPVKGYG